MSNDDDRIGADDANVGEGQPWRGSIDFYREFCGLLAVGMAADALVSSDASASELRAMVVACSGSFPLIECIVLVRSLEAHIRNGRSALDAIAQMNADFEFSYGSSAPNGKPRIVGF